MITWERKSGTPGINYATGYLNGLNWNLCSATGVISGTDSNSIDAAISTDQLDATTYFDVAWEQQDLSSIKFCRLYYNSCSSVTQNPATPITVSESSSLSNSNPSIISYTGNTRIAWEANYPRYIFKTIELCDPWNSQYWQYSQTYTRSPSINKPDDNSAFYLAWSWGKTGSGLLRFVSSNNLSTITNFNINGGDIQLGNGSSSSNMYATAYSPFSAPYYFQQTNSIGSLGKINPNSINSGRGCIITKDNTEFFYSFGDITVDNKSIGFVKAVNKTKYNNMDNLNTALISEPFNVKDNSEILFSDYSGTSDSAKAAVLLGDTGYVSYKIDVLDNATGKVIGTLREANFGLAGLHDNNLYSYKLGTSGLIGKVIRLKVMLSTNINHPEFALINNYADSGSVGKLSLKNLALNGTNTITDYSLSQNYPNPFNPATVINYQLPKDGLVTLKIYNELGQEVKTLVNQYQSTGNYSVDFNASDLASGVYFYKLQAGDFISVKKMILLK